MKEELTELIQELKRLRQANIKKPLSHRALTFAIAALDAQYGYGFHISVDPGPWWRRLSEWDRPHLEFDVSMPHICWFYGGPFYGSIWKACNAKTCKKNVCKMKRAT